MMIRLIYQFAVQGISENLPSFVIELFLKKSVTISAKLFCFLSLLFPRRVIWIQSLLHREVFFLEETRNLKA